MTKRQPTLHAKLPFLVKRAQNHIRKRYNAPVQPWEQLYEAAISEKDMEKMLGKIAEAERAISNRALELRSEAGNHAEERKALADAAALLCEMKLILLRHVVRGSSKNG
jgi:hypothetical protein